MKSTRERLKERLGKRQQAVSPQVEEQAQDWSSKIKLKKFEVGKLNQKVTKLMEEAKKDFNKNPSIVTGCQQCVTAAREFIAMLEQFEAEGFIYDGFQSDRELCQTIIHIYSPLIGKGAQVSEAVRELKKSNPQHSVSMYVLGWNHFLRNEFKQASSYFKRSQLPQDQFYFFYSEARRCQFLNPADNKSVEENYKKAEKIYEAEPSKISKNTIDIFYCDWAKFYKSIDRIEDIRQPLDKGAKLGGVQCQNLYSIYLRENPLKDTKDTVDALDWCKKAAEQGHVESRVIMTSMKLQYIFVVPEMPSSEQELAAQYFKELSDLSEQSLRAKMEMADCIAIGKGVDKDIPKAVKILQEVIEDKKDENEIVRLEAQFCLGQLFCQNGSVKEGVRLLQAAASKKHYGAQINLALFHEIGWGVEVNSLVAENLLKEAARMNRFGYQCWQAFLKRRVDTGAISQARYEEKSKELSSTGLSLYKPYIFDPSLSGGDPSHFTTQSYDDGINHSYYKQVNSMIISIVKSPIFYIDDRIHALFCNIAMAETLDSANLVNAIFNIGKLFAKISYASCDIISQYTTQISALVDRLSAKAPKLKAQEIALALDGISKLQLNPEQDSLRHNIILLLTYARINITDFNPKDLSMAVSGLIRLGLSWSVFSEYLKLFLQHIQNRWKQFEPVTLMHFAYMFAILDVDQPDNQPRLISIRLLEQLFRNINAHLDSLQMDTHAASQLDLALRYFTKRYYEKAESALPSLGAVREGFKKKGKVTIPPGNISGFEHQVCRFIVGKMGKKALETQVEVNGLKVDALVNKKLVLQVQGPSHYKYLLGKSIMDEKGRPVPTAKDKFHDTLCEQAGYPVKHMPFFIWQTLSTDKEKEEHLCSEDIISTMK